MGKSFQSLSSSTRRARVHWSDKVAVRSIRPFSCLPRPIRDTTEPMKKNIPVLLLKRPPRSPRRHDVAKAVRSQITEITIPDRILDISMMTLKRSMSIEQRCQYLREFEKFFELDDDTSEE